jgi:hypothetical protein
MARVEAVVICLLVLAMDVAAGVLGVYAEKAQNQASFRVVGKLFSFHCRVSGNQGAGASSVFRNQAGWPWPPLTRCGWRLQGRHLRILFVECRQPVRRAYELGMAAAAVLAAAHAIANAAGGCACACSGDKLRRASPNRQMASFALVLTWYVTTLVALHCIALHCQGGMMSFTDSCMHPPLQRVENKRGTLPLEQITLDFIIAILL